MHPVLPHELIGVLEPSEDGSRVRLHASSNLDQPGFEVPVPPRDIARVKWEV